METTKNSEWNNSRKIPFSEQPLVSVVVPVFNGIGNEIERCVNSIKYQTYSKLEVIFVDDLSSDNSVLLIEKLLEGFPHRVIRHKRNVGLSQTWNDGICNSNGEYILLLQQDCFLLTPNTLEDTMVRILKDQEQILSGTQYVNLDSLNEFQKILRLRINEGGATPFSDGRNSITENKCDLIRKSCFDRIGKFDGTLNQSGQDFIFSMKVRDIGLEIKVASELKYSIFYNGEDTLLKLIKKEYGYGKVLIRLFVYLKRGNFFEKKKNNNSMLMKKKYRSRIANISFPFAFLLGTILSSFLSMFDFIMWFFPFILLWLTYQARVIFINNKNNQLKIPLVTSIFIMITLDMAYFIGSLVGFKKIIVDNFRLIAYSN